MGFQCRPESFQQTCLPFASSIPVSGVALVTCVMAACVHVFLPSR